jgi:hypothetical protein
MIYDHREFTGERRIVGTAVRGANALSRRRLVSNRTTAMVVDISLPSAFSANAA